MTTSCRLHHASSDAGHAVSTDSLPQPTLKTMNGNEEPAAPDEELLTHEGRLRTGIHKGWTSICIGTAKCDHCNQQSRGVVQKCNFCGWSICRECSAMGKLAGNKKHKLDHDAVNWDRKTADTKRPSTRKNAPRKKKAKPTRGTTKTEVDPRAVVEEIPPNRPVADFGTDPRSTFHKPTCDAETQTQISLEPLWIHEGPATRGVFARKFAVEDQDAANILAQMPSSDGPGPVEEENTSSDAAPLGLPEYLHPRPTLAPSHNLFPYPARVGTTYEQHTTEYGTSQNKPLSPVGSRHYPSLYPQTRDLNRSTMIYHQPVAEYTTLTQSRLPSPQTSRRPLLPVQHNRGAFYIGGNDASEHYAPEPPREYNRSGYGHYEPSYYGTRHSASPTTLPSPFSDSKKRKTDNLNTEIRYNEQNQPWYQTSFDQEINKVIQYNRITAETHPTWSPEECFQYVQVNETPPEADSLPFEWRCRFIDMVYLRAAEKLALDTTRIQFQESANHKKIRTA